MTDTLQRLIEESSRKKVRLKINDNRSTMLSVKWEPDCTVVSMHRMFLSAPQNVMEELACYIRLGKKSAAPSTVKAYIEDNFKRLDYSHLVDKSKLNSCGDVYELQELYDALNSEYFSGSLKLSITWYGRIQQRYRSRINLGLYHDPLKQIRIHKALDNIGCPEYVVAFVIYHEMVHSVCPPYFDDRGFNRIHSKEFKEKEAKYNYYDAAQRWLKANADHFFTH